MSTPVNIQPTTNDGSALAKFFIESRVHCQLFLAARFLDHRFIPTDLLHDDIPAHFNRISAKEYRPPNGKDVLVTATVPGEADKIAGFALWRIPVAGEPGKKWMAHHGFRPQGQFFCEGYFATHEVEKEVQRECGEDGKFCSIQMLVVHRDYEGEGVEQGLIHWGVKQAAVEGIPVMAVATSQQKELYERNGFQMKRTAELVPGHERVYLVKDTVV
ncbi:hypothetical protein N8T08_011052 [Aspergillus melleus]|uniref:Uncharacterized protein n=1 Tax=Aspergillus melleus TaxID=138277 RepID=A0ACC3AQA6_9EURO|nr:hypothetical protein N8T08_011052 [Aspergillus melleus]